MNVTLDVVRVQGADAASFLQGQLSQDVAALAVGADAWSFVLAPAGRVDAFVRVRREADDVFVVIIDAGYGEQLVARLKRFLLRTKATVELETAAGGDVDAEAAAKGVAARIVAGIPAMGAEIDERCVPAETGWVAAAVSFAKGCFVGQELVARMDSRTAEPPRRLVRLSTNPGHAVAAGDDIVVGGQVAGCVTSATERPEAAGAVALGYVKRGTPLEGPAVVGGHPATIDGPAGG